MHGSNPYLVRGRRKNKRLVTKFFIRLFHYMNSETLFPQILGGKRAFS